MIAPAARTVAPDSAALAVLQAFGIERPSQIPLLLPVGYDDFTAPCGEIDTLAHGVPTAVEVRAVESPTRCTGGLDRVRFKIEDATGSRYTVTLYGDDPELGKGIADGVELLMLVVAKPWQGGLHLTCKEIVDTGWKGRARPTYPGRKGGDTRERVRAVVAGYLRPNVSRATQHVTSQLEAIAPVADLLTSVGCPDWTIEALIWETHRPSSAAMGEHARRAYMELAALAAIHRKHSGHQPRRATAHSVRTLGRRVAQLPHALTNDQRAAVKGIAAKLAEPVAMRAILAADVGTGKSWVALVLAAALADVGARTIVMAPTYPLAVQLAEEFARLYGDITSCLVADNHDDTHAATAMVVVGTSAVLTRDLGRFDLVVVDEQQRWSRSQREHYVSGDTHLLEMSATCIPRTQALIQFGKVAVFPMRETHAPKTIHTYLWEGDGAEMFRHVRGAIQAGRPVMVIYPKRESADDEGHQGGRKGRGKKKPQAGGIDDRHSIEQALPRWEAKYPGRVRAMTGDDDNDVKTAAIDDIREGRAQILLTTTVVEVGISVANLFDIVVVHPDRYGVTTLHQLRGRVARNGGEGHCHLWCPGPISAKTRDRLDAVLSTTDGFKLAEMDLQQRGTGDLGSESSTQSGADQTMLFGVPLTVELIESVMPHWDYFSGRSAGRPTG